MKSKFHLAAAALSLLGVSQVHAQLSWSNVYGTVGFSYTDLRRAAPADALVTRDSKNDLGYTLGVGYQFHSKFAVELSRFDLGTAKLTDVNPGGPNYWEQSAVGTLLAAKYTPVTWDAFSPFVKLGTARIKVAETGTDGTVRNDARSRTYGALGVDYRATPQVTVGLTYEYFWATQAADAAPVGAPPRLRPHAVTLGTRISF